MYVTNLDDKRSKGTYWILLFIDRNTAVYFNSLGFKYIFQEVFSKIKDKSTAHNTIRIRDNDCFMCGVYCIGFIKDMLARKNF